MAKQLIFSQIAVDELSIAFTNAGGDQPYLQTAPFATDRKTLESPTIDAPEQLFARVNPDSDLDTAIALYEAYPKLNNLEASSRGFWTYLTHIDLWDYMHKRFKLSADMNESARRHRIKEKWFLGEPSQGNLMRHPLAGLWWGVKLTVAPERGDGNKYELTRILFRDLDVATRTLGTYQLGRLPKAIKGILGYIADHPDDFKSSFEPKMRYIMKHFNSLGGVLQLGCLDSSFYGSELDRVKSEWIVAKKPVFPKAESVNESVKSAEEDITVSVGGENLSSSEPSSVSETPVDIGHNVTPEAYQKSAAKKKSWLGRIFG